MYNKDEKIPTVNNMNEPLLTDTVKKAEKKPEEKIKRTVSDKNAPYDNVSV